MKRDQTRLALLGVLSVEPASGYDVREAITSTLGHFWHESYGQIYPTLSQLEQERLIEVVERDGRKKVYAITKAGKSELARLLAQPGVPSRPRNSLLLRLFFGRWLGVEACRDLVAQAAQDASARLAEYAALEDRLCSEFADQPDLPFWLLTLRHGQRGARATIDWAKDAAELLDDLDERNDP